MQDVFYQFGFILHYFSKPVACIVFVVTVNNKRLLNIEEHCFVNQLRKQHVIFTRRIFFSPTHIMLYHNGFSYHNSAMSNNTASYYQISFYVFIFFRISVYSFAAVFNEIRTDYSGTRIFVKKIHLFSSLSGSEISSWSNIAMYSPFASSKSLFLLFEIPKFFSFSR